MSATATFDPDQILKTLQLHRVRFVVIGGLAAEVHDCGWTTFDLDIIVATEPENFDALETALSALEAVYNDPAGRRIVPTAHRMTTLRGPQLLRTKAGRLDVLREAGAARRSRRLQPMRWSLATEQ